MTAAERISFEKELQRIEIKLKEIRDRTSHDAWGPMYDDFDKSEIRKLKERRNELKADLGCVA